MLDASLTLAWALPDEANTYTDAMLHQVATGKAWVPATWPYDVAKGLLGAQRRTRLTLAQAMAFTRELLQLPIAVDLRSPADILNDHLRLSRRFGFSVYDAAYLDLALRTGFALMTQDATLRAGALQAGVKLA